MLPNTDTHKLDKNKKLNVNMQKFFFFLRYKTQFLLISSFVARFNDKKVQCSCVNAALCREFYINYTRNILYCDSLIAKQYTFISLSIEQK